MADTSHSSYILGYCSVDLELQEVYPGTKLKVLLDLFSDVILGHEFLQHHSSVEIPFGGSKPPLKLCSLAAVKVPPPSPLQ